ncbi:hypothetical protein SLS53_007988 [Cytospora paraplurivora]|uniref:Actin-like ATPase domain-containing protein n=1 Tax=Cytospora paraplurivora TaxID=2898453 RepID=A0AAN9YD78_9PEZI
MIKCPRNGKMEWGFNYDKSQTRYEWFKLEQYPKYTSEELELAYPPTSIRPENEHKAQELITEYLKNLRKHVEKSIKDSVDVGGPSKDVLFRDVRWEYIITVPAMWPESAHNITEKCAKDAGLAPNRRVQIIAEPEAAGIYALEEMCQELELKPGDTFVICDAGGGTVDLISYTVTRPAPNPELEEAAAGTGGLCGSSFLDREFHKWLDNHFKGCVKWDAISQADALEKWESEVKRNFTGDDNKRYIIPARRIDDDRALGVKNGKLEISGARMRKIFDPVVSQIVQLVNGQIKAVDKSVNAVLLAGGFGRNEYLRKSIQTAVGDGVKVKRMEHCNTAIVRGALIKGLADRQPSTSGRPTIAVMSRLARKHYGTKALQKYSPGFHDSQQPRHAGGVDGGERLDVMSWFIKKNTRIKDYEPKDFPFYYDQSVTSVEWNGGLDPLTLPIYTCDLDDAPLYPDPERAKSRKCKQLVSVKADLNKIPKEKLTKEMGEDNEMYYKIWFQIRMTTHLANITFKLVHDNVEYGTVDTDWDTT